jgi:hypothetical protein
MTSLPDRPVMNAPVTLRQRLGDVLFDILLVVLGAAMLLYRKPLGRYMARVQQDQARKKREAMSDPINRVSPKFPQRDPSAG